MFLLLAYALLSAVVIMSVVVEKIVIFSSFAAGSLFFAAFMHIR